MDMENFFNLAAASWPLLELFLIVPKKRPLPVSVTDLWNKQHLKVLNLQYLHKGPYFNYVSTILSIFDQLSTLVSMFTK